MRAAGLHARSGTTMFFSIRERMDSSPARVPPRFSQYENAWIARPLGCHHGFRILRAAGLRARSGATMFFLLRERMDRSSARVPQWFPDKESGWIRRPLGCHRVFLTTRTHGSLVRSGATMVSAPGEVLDYAPARGGGGAERGGEGMMVSKKLNLKT